MARKEDEKVIQITIARWWPLKKLRHVEITRTGPFGDTVRLDPDEAKTTYEALKDALDIKEQTT